MKSRSLGLVFALALPSARALSSGTQAGEFIPLLSGPRAQAMGEAYAGLAEGVETMFWNPAGLGFLKKQEAQLSYGLLYEGLRYETLSYATPLPYGIRFGIVWGQLSTGGIPKTIATQFGLLTEEPGEFKGVDEVGILSLAYKYNKTLSIGINGKRLKEKIDSAQDSTMTLDAGLRVDTPWKLRLGLSYLNAGGNLTFLEESQKLSNTLRAGASLQAFRNMILAADFSKPSRDNLTATAGAEYTYIARATKGKPPTSFAFRFGFKPETAEAFELFDGLTFGLGFNFSRYKLNYALISYGDFGWTHRFGLNFRFNSRYSDDRAVKDSDATYFDSRTQDTFWPAVK